MFCPYAPSDFMPFFRSRLVSQFSTNTYLQKIPSVLPMEGILPEMTYTLLLSESF
jgi:hypothetical protein